MGLVAVLWLGLSIGGRLFIACLPFIYLMMTLCSLATLASVGVGAGCPGKRYSNLFSLYA